MPCALRSAAADIGFGWLLCGLLFCIERSVLERSTGNLKSSLPEASLRAHSKKARQRACISRSKRLPLAPART